ncbi:uncharacterized protein LOC132548606 [Ylistrum balloti]|uniref:uncharacterized protein LOC132548606 n=1 Tax=Ylistrum balloti TaxID=509963 RepID=UPI0029058343|nr:uncharacterized protein LOC132548606 [Ylistrum balloti]
MEGTTCTIANNFMKGFGILVVFLAMGLAKPVRESAWVTPCGGPAATPPPGLPVPPPVTVVEDMLPIFEESKTKALALKDKYKTERINMTNGQLSLYENMHLDGMPECCLSSSEIMQSLSDMTLAHQSSYEKISRDLVFLEQMSYDEYMFESPSYNDELKSLYTDCLSLLCNLQKLILNAEANIEYVDSSIMSDSLRQPENAFQRGERNFVIIKDVHRTLENLETQYNAIKNHLSN